MKYNRKNRTIVFGILVGVASIYAIASYFDVEMAELNSFLVYTLLMFGGILLMAVLAVVVIKLAGKLFSVIRGNHEDKPDDRE